MVVVVGALVLCGLGGWQAATVGWWAVLGLVLSFVDIAVHRLPAGLIAVMTVGTAAALAVEAAATSRWPTLAAATGMGLGVAVVMAVVSLVAPRGLGLGDAQLGLPIGLLAGWWGWPTLLAGVVWIAIIGLALAVGLLIAGRATMRSALPYGPVLLAGAFVAVLAAA